MKKLSLALFGFAILLAGCSTQNNTDLQGVTPQEDTSTPLVENEMLIEKPLTPIEALVAENLFTLGKDEIYPTKTELRSERMLPDDPKDFPWLKVFIVEEGLPDDSVKSSEYEVHLKRQQDGSWKVIHQELLNFECYRGKTNGGCI
jgi:hypothetical protein